MAESKNIKQGKKPQPVKQIKKENIKASKTKLEAESPPSDGSSVSSVSAQEEDNEDEAPESRQIGTGVATATVAINREEYLTAHRDLTFDRNRLQVLNNILHRRLAEYYKKRKCDHVLKPLEGAVDLEEKYQQKLLGYEDMKIKAEKEIADIKDKVAEVEAMYSERLKHANKQFDELQELERSTGSGLIYSRKGKPMAVKTVERFLTLQKRQCEQLSALTLRYLRARNAVAELEALVKNLETLGPGLYVFQYEQLNIDNQNFNNKIEEREDELVRKRAKCTEHNEILAHIREKMHHTDEVIDIAECDLGDAEIDFSKAREDLSMIKRHRNKLRRALEEERMKAGLLSRKDLLRDFQASIEVVEKLESKKKALEEQVAKTAIELRNARLTVKQHGPIHRLPPPLPATRNK